MYARNKTMSCQGGESAQGAAAHKKDSQNQPGDLNDFQERSRCVNELYAIITSVPKLCMIDFLYLFKIYFKNDSVAHLSPLAFATRNLSHRYKNRPAA